MKIILIGHGKVPIPPNGWGGVERVIHDIDTHLTARGHEVEILNIPHRHVLAALTLRILKKGRVDVLWCHNERLVPVLAKFHRLFANQFIETCHSAMTDLNPEDLGRALPIRRAARADLHLCLHPTLSRILLNLNPNSRILPFKIGLDVQSVRIVPKGNGKAICLGRVSGRKRQRLVLDELERHGIPVDFAGPESKDLPECDRVSHLPSYLGSWTTDEVRERLTEYSALVLWSTSEVQPLAVIEALAAGLDVVVSPEALGVLDGSLPFVHVVRSISDLAETTRLAINGNDRHRDAIRTYAESDWDWGAISEQLSDEISRKFSTAAAR